MRKNVWEVFKMGGDVKRGEIGKPTVLTFTKKGK